MTKTATTRTIKKVAAKKTAPKKSVAKTVSRPTVSKPRAKASSAQKSTKVDYYPNRMTVAVSALAGTVLVLVAVIAVLGTHS